MATYRIYALQDPETGDTRYVGITRQELKARLYSHLSEARRQIGNSHRENWIRSLQARDLAPLITLLEETDDPEREGYWITHYRDKGAKLVNGLALCEGLNEHDEAAKRKIAEANRKRWEDPEHRNRVIAALTGRKKSPEHIEKVRQFHLGKQWALGRKHTKEEIARMSASQKGKPRPPDSIEKMKATRARPEVAQAHREACARRSSNPEYRAKLSAAAKKRFQKPEATEAD